MYFYREIIPNLFLLENHFQCIFIAKSFLVYFYSEIISNIFL